MKATGIVRRIEEYGIIGQTSKNRINTRVFADLPHPTHWCRNRVLAIFLHSKSEVKFTSLLVICQRNFLVFQENVAVQNRLNY